MKDASPEQLFAALRRFAMERDRYVNQLARSEHLTRAEFDTLDYIEEAGELTPTALATRLGLTTGAVTSVLDRLEGAGFVKRSPNPTDRRSIMIRLTRRTESAGKAALGGYVDRVLKEGRRLSPKERELMIRFLQTATEALTNGEPQ